MSAKTIGQALLPQFDKVCRSVREIIELCPVDEWTREGVGGMRLKHVYHTVAGLDFYCRTRAHVWDERFKDASGHYNWDVELADPPTREEMLAYLQDVHAHLRTWLLQHDDEAYLAADGIDEFSNDCLLEQMVYALRHTQHHVGVLAVGLSSIDLQTTWR